MAVAAPGDRHGRYARDLETRRRRFPKGAVAYWDRVVVLDAILGALMIFVGYPVTASLPGHIVVTVLVVAVGAFRHPRFQVRWGGLMAIAVTLLYVYLVVVSIQQGTAWGQRITKFALLALLAVVIAGGRIDYRSLIIGGCIGAVINVPLFYAGLATDNYPPFLTGFYGDKNVSGMYYALWGILGLMVVARRWRVPWALLSLAFLFLTGSRTAIAAFLLALGWVLLRNRLPFVLRLVATAVGYGVLRFVENNYAEVAIYSDRYDDDWFRRQVDVATFAKEAVTPWFGQGLNEGYVILSNGRFMWFHDSYAQALVEGGYIFLWATLIAFFLFGMGIFSRRRKVSEELLVAEAGVIVILVCGWKLGEVFMTLGAFMTLGLVLALRFGEGRAGRGGPAEPWAQ